jgi:hypothetical protein
MNVKRKVVYVWALYIPNGTLLEAQGTIERMIEEGGKAQGKLSSTLVLLLFPTFPRIVQIVFVLVVIWSSDLLMAQSAQTSRRF